MPRALIFVKTMDSMTLNSEQYNSTRRPIVIVRTTDLFPTTLQFETDNPHGYYKEDM